MCAWGQGRFAYLSPKRFPHSGHRAGISSVSYSQEIAGQARNEVVGAAMRLMSRPVGRKGPTNAP